MAFQPFSNKDIRRFFVLFWGMAFLVLQLTFQLVFQLSWGTAFTDNAISIIGIVLCLGIVNKTKYLPKIQGYQLIPACIVLTVLAALCLAVTAGILYYLNWSDTAYHEFLWQSLPFRFLYTWFIVTGFTFMNYIWQKSLMRTKERDKTENLRKMAKDAELDKIYQQLHPHFLFNSLNAINTLMVSSPDKASQMVQQLSDFLRGSLKKVHREYIPFREEIDHLRLYLALEEIRFGKRLKTDIDLHENIAESELPPLILQPLIENAIKFGLYGTLGKVTIHLKSQVFRNYLYIEIANPFDDDAQPPKGTGFGLKSVRRRLFLLYGRHDLVRTKRHRDIFTTYLKIPQRYDKSPAH